MPGRWVVWVFGAEVDVGRVVKGSTASKLVET